MEREVKDLVHLKDCAGHLRWGIGDNLPVNFDLRIAKNGDGLIEIETADPAALQLSKIYRNVEAVSIVASNPEGSAIEVTNANIKSLTIGANNITKAYNISAVLIAGSLHVGFKEVVELDHGKPKRQAMYFVKGLTRTLAFSARLPPWTVTGNSEKEAESHNAISSCIVFDLDDEVGDEFNFLEQCDQLVQRVLEVLSVAVGTSLVWSFRKTFVAGQSVQLTFRSTQVVGEPWYPMFHSLNLSPVVALALGKYTPEIRAARGLDVSIYWYLNTSQKAEASYLHLMTALEHMVTKYTEGKSKAYFDKAYFTERIRPVLSKAAASLEEGGMISRSDLEFVDGKLGEINRVSLRSSLAAMLNEWNVYTDDLTSRITLADIITVRNRITHQGALSEDDKKQSEFWESLYVLIELLKRIFMSSWGYEGKYISHLKGFEEVSYPPDVDMPSSS